MARIPIYTSQQTPNGGFLRPQSVPPIDLGGIVQGLGQMQAGIERQRQETDRELKLQEQQREMADKAAAREQYLSMRDLLADRADEHIAGIGDGTVDKTSARTKWDESTRALVEMGLDKVPPSQRSQIQSLLATDGARFERVIARAVRKKDQTDTLGAIGTTLEYAARQSEADPQGARVLAMQTLQELGPWAGLSAAQIQEKATRWREEAAYTRGLGVVTRSKGDNAALGAAEKALDGLEDLDPRRKVELQARIEGYRATNDQRALAAAQRAEIEAERRERKAAGAFQALSTTIANGKMPDEPTLATYHSAMRGTDYEKAVPELLKQASAQAAVALKPAMQQQAELDQLRAQAVKATNPAIEREIKRREQILAADERDYKADPIGAHIERGLAQPVPLNFDDPASIQARVEQAKSVEVKTGKPAGILRPHEAEALTQRFEKLAPVEKEALVRRIYESAGPKVGRATFAQLGKQAPLLAVAAGLAGTQTTGKGGEGQPRSVSQLIFRGEELLKTKAVNIPGRDKPEGSAEMEDEFFEYAGQAIPNPQARLAAVQAVGMVYATLMHEAGKVNERGVDRKTFRTAASLVTGGVIEHNGSKVLPPRYGMPADESRNLLRGITPDQVKAWGGVAGMGDQEAATFLRGAPLESQTFGRYRVPHGAGVLLRPDGTPFEMLFR